MEPVSSPAPSAPSSSRAAPFAFTVAQVPGAKEGFDAFATALWSQDGAVPRRSKELIFLRTSILNDCVT